jgi:TonB family protein
MFVGGPPRDEFETSAEYEKRRAEFLSVGAYPFVLAEVSFAYDADSGHFVIRVPSKRVRAANANAPFTAFEAASVLPDDSTAWLREVSAVAGESSTSTYNVLLLNWQQDATDIIVPMPRDKARDTKPILRVLAMVSLGPTAAQWVMTQTIDDYLLKNPIDQLHQAHDASELAGRYELTLAGELESIRVYEYRTGEVVARIVPDAARAASAPSLEATASPDTPVKMTLALAEYPEVARRARIAGVVIAEVTVALDGSVKSVKILKPLPFGVDNSVAKAIEASSFEPAMRGGLAVEDTIQITYKFDLQVENGVPAPSPKP